MLNEKLKEQRIKKGLTQEEAGKQLFVSRSLIAKWEQGRAVPTSEYINKICAIYNCKEDDLFGYPDIEAQSKTISKKKTILNILTISVLLLIIIVYYLLMYFYHGEMQNKDIFSRSVRKEWGIEDMIIYDDGMYSNKNKLEIMYDNKDQSDFEKYANYVFMYLQCNPKVDEIFYLADIDDINKKYILKHSDELSSYYLDSESTAFIYTLKNDINKFYVINISFNLYMYIRLGTDYINPKNDSNYLFEYTVEFEE